MPTSVGRSYNPVYAPVALPWVAGRFYDSFITSGATTTVIPGLNCHVVPFLVPNTIVATALGIEVSGAATAGTTFRLALYTTDTYGMPGTLITSGTCVADATGFQSVALSQQLQAGIVWGAIGQTSAAANATIRALPTTPLHLANIANIGTLAATGYNAIVVGNTGDDFATFGFPKVFFKMGDNVLGVNFQASVAAARVMIGV